MIEPMASPSVFDVQGRVGLPASKVDLDPSVVGPMPGEPTPSLRREGDFIIDRAGQVRQDAVAGLWLIDFNTAPPGEADATGFEPLPTMVIQPSQRLTTLQQIIELSAGRAQVRVSGQVHVYRGTNYLLLTAIGGLASPASETPDTGQPSTAQPPVDTAPPLAGPAPASPLDLLASMSSDRKAGDDANLAGAMDIGGAGFVSTGGGGQGAPSPADAGSAAEPQAPLQHEGDLIIQRAGRVVRSEDGNAVLFAFEADGTQQSEPPMMLMPCRLRATLEDIVTEQGDSVAFILSGRVYAYGGNNFLLPTTMRIRTSDTNILR